ncbi:hypothetical protein GM31_20135 [Trabulsiella odontotermitis]|uniref:Fimbrial-type adhesion domain-containing protein n=2 Tax=Trabulsiella odontotermitis TaxID=379893 RepID=A0A0L0GVV0_9ENTR|nr:hypothetical protein GM31_20135 [Trabulsiella odontotermitis]
MEVLVNSSGRLTRLASKPVDVNYSPATASWVVPVSGQGNTDYVSTTSGEAVNIPLTAWAGDGAFTEFSSHYSGNVTVQLGANSKVWTYDITLEPPLSTCSVTPPSPVNFGTVAASGNETTLAVASTRIAASCLVYDSSDVGKGMYFTFDKGTDGLYNADVKKLATSLDGIYITGGSDSAQAMCANSNMSFNNAVLPDFRVADIPGAGTTNASEDVYFSLCHDITKPVVTGNMTSDASVNVVIQ